MASWLRTSGSFGLGLALAAVVLAGCGTQAGSGLAVRPASVKIQKESMDLTGDGGRFNVVFAGLKGGYHVQATREDIAKVRITLTSPRLAAPLVKEVGADELNQLVVTVPFTNVPAGDVQVQVQALDKDGQLIGAKASTSNVTQGQTTVLQLTVRLDANTGTGNLATTITFEDATPAPSPTPTPSATPTPVPSASPTATATPTPTPSPTATPTVVLESYRLVRHLFGNPEVEITLHNPTAADASARVYMYFYNDNVLKDKQAREIPLTADQRMTFRVKANAYLVNRVNVIVN